MSRVFDPVYSSTSDGSDITLCRILEAAGSIKDAIAGGGGGGATAANPAVGPDGITRVPLNVNSDGELKVNVEASVDADLAQIENKLDTLIGIATPQAADVASIDTEAQAIDAKLPALSSGRIPVVADNAASQVFNYTATGAVAANTVLIGPIDCSQFREIAVHCTALTNGTANLQISNDGSSWVAANYITPTGLITTNLSAVTIANCPLYNSRFFRVIQSVAQTAGTTTLVAYASQQATPKLYQSVTGTVSLSSNNPAPIPVTGAGFQIYHTLVSAASTNATSVKVSAGTIGTCVLTNVHNQFRFVKFFNLAVAPTMGTSTPVIQFPIAPSSTLDVSTAFAGLRFATGIAYAITHNAALLDNTPVNAGEVLVNLSYV
jgi:hypothetical protein